MSDTEKLSDAVALVLENQEPPTEEALGAFVRAQAAVIQMTDKSSYTEEEIKQVIKHLKSQFDHKMSMGALFEAEDYIPWLRTRQGDIDWYYWHRYRKHLLTTKKFPPHVVRTLDEITDKILDRIEDPLKEGSWNRRGMVVGHVQSGKTANYTGLVCKAADAGYKVIIVLAGMLNSLRNQTQERLDADFMGYCTRIKNYVGASRFDPEKRRRPFCLTSSIEDFKKATANAINFNLDASKEPVVFVLKKNKSTLETLHSWLLEHNKHNMKEYSMLMIDDEADHASVNTNKDEDDPTTINRAIRNILSIFSRSSFVGYTATPFANIFIDPESEDEMANGDAYKDLFPKDFILSLDPPTNYIGPHRIFTGNADLDSIRTVDDHMDLLPIRHKIDFEPEALPQSLHKAIHCFILAKAIRLLRGQRNKHYSMMVNASRFTRVQDLLKGLISERVKGLRGSVSNYASLPPKEALNNSDIQALHVTWQEEYSSLEFSWERVQGALKEAIDPAEVISVNRNSQESLDYSDTDYPSGRTVIAVGGIGLSRGLTLEGLLVSYFLRNSVMYDTLMQMGRWFGYRDGYADVCRIFMTGQAESWYSHIAEATEELREDFRSMEKLKLTPLEFGLRVRSHPTALIVTARNKMRKGTKIPHRISLEGRLIETIALSSVPEIIQENLALTDAFIRGIQNTDETVYKKTSIGHFWNNVPIDQLQGFLERFKNHPESFYTFYPKPLIEHLDGLKADFSDGMVLIRTLKPKDDDGKLPIGSGLTGTAATRNESTAQIENGYVSFKKKARLGESIDESVGLLPEVVSKIKSDYAPKTVNPRAYREVKERKPLLIIHPLKLPLEQELVVGYGLSLPGEADTRRPKKLVEYVVNIPYWKNVYEESSVNGEEPE